METHLRVTWAMMKADKSLCTFQRINTRNDDYVKEFEAYIKVIESYRVKTAIHHGLVNTNLIKMEFMDANHPTPEEKYQAEE